MMNTTMRRFGGAFGATVVLAFTAVASPQYRVEMTTSGYTGSETLLEFPVLVKFAEGSPSGFSYSQFKQAGGADLAFEDADGNKLAYEIDTWNEEGTSFVWVKVPELTAATKIVATWGDADATGAAGSVWSAAGYFGVWHMGETDNQGTTDYASYDSSGNGLTAIPKLGTSNSDVTQMVSREDGAVGRARVNQDIASGSKKGGNCLAVNGYTNHAAAVAAKGELTVSGWFNISTWYKNERMFGQKASYLDANGFEVQLDGSSRTYKNDNGFAASLAQATAPISTWLHYAFVIRGTEKESAFYLNGVEKKTGVLPAIVANQLPFVIGNNTGCSESAYSGSYDEVRLLLGSVSTDWVKAEYDTVANAAFCEAGAVVDVGSLDSFAVEAALDGSVGTVVPAFGKKTGLADGETVDFSASDEEYPYEGSYLLYTGYRLYVTIDGVETLAEDSTSLSGRYTHVKGQTARLVWKQQVRTSGASFETAYASIVSVPGYEADETLRNVQVLFRLAADKPEGFSYGDCQPNGADILFTDAAGHVIPHEIEKWDPEGESLVWVNLPKLAKGTTFRFCYGNADVTEAPNKSTDTWVDAGYAGVWHMNEANASDAAKDSTANANAGAPTGADTSQMTAMDGILCGARRLDSGAINYFNVANGDSLDLGETFVAGGWFKGTPVNNLRPFNRKAKWDASDGWEIQWNSATTATPRGSNGGTAGMQTLPAIGSSWGYFVWAYDGETVTTYANGVKVGDTPIARVVDNDQPLHLGGSKAFKGGFDEMRLRAGKVSAAQVKADYDTIVNADFLFAAKVAAAGDSDTFLVEAGNGERGTVTPPWGKVEKLANGQLVAFSAPPGGQTTADPTTNFCFTGYELYVTKDGIEALREKKDALSGSYTHVKGQSARLVWYTADMPRVSVLAGAGGTVEGSGYYVVGTTATLTAVPSAGMRFREWTGDLPEGVKATDATITFAVDKTYSLTATFAEKPVCAAFFSWKGHAEGETVTTGAAGNDIGSETFASGAVSTRGASGMLPAFSTYRPGAVVYTDALRNDVLATDPGSIYFTAAPRSNLRSSGGDVAFDTLGTWISQQETCTVEFFCRQDTYQQYAGVWSMTLSGETQVLYAPDSGDNVLAFAVEKTVKGVKGRATPTDGNTGLIPEAWQHVAVVYDRANQKVTCYRNYGTGAEKSLVITETTDAVPFFLGSAHAFRDSNNFNGWISCLRVTKGALKQEDFMRVGMTGGADDTVALWDFRGKSGETVGALKPVVGDAKTFRAAAGVGLTYGASVPGEAIYAGLQAVEEKKPLSKRVGSVVFPKMVNGYLEFPSLSSALSELDAYTLECFVRSADGAIGNTVFSWNDIGLVATEIPVVLQVPGISLNGIRLAGCGHTTDIKFADALADGAWHHLAVTYSPDTDLYTAYLDYGAIGTIAADGKRKPTMASFLVGGRLGKTDKDLFGGEISCLRVTKRALTTDEFLRAGPKPQIGFMLLVK